MTAPLGDLGPDQFLAEYWQKKPCLIREAIHGFEPLLDGNDLAGLACEEMAESRLVSGSFEAADWKLTHGPFSDADFAALPAENWTLLVQDVEKHYAPLQDLVQLFSFIPAWRLDDLMVSFAATGGSVGPHVDQYDVFLVQAEGRRRWQISQSFDPELLQDCPLNVLKQFEPEQDWVLEPGDMLYLPPNVAHHGIALEPGMTWSIGCRAASAADLLQGLGEWLAFYDGEGSRYSDPDLIPVIRAGEISPDALLGLRKMMLTSIDKDRGLDDFLGVFMSRFRLAHDPQSPPTRVTGAQVLKMLKQGKQLLRNPWTRLLWIEVDAGARLFAAGQTYNCNTRLAETLCAREHVEIEAKALSGESLETLTQLVNEGHFVIA